MKKYYENLDLELRKVEHNINNLIKGIPDGLDTSTIWWTLNAAEDAITAARRAIWGKIK